MITFQGNMKMGNMEAGNMEENKRPGTIAGIVLEYAKADPGRLCVVDEKRTWTYGEIAGAVRRTAEGLVKRGLKKGDRVLVKCMQDAPYLITDFACVMAGMVFVPLEKEASLERALDIEGETEASLYVGEKIDGLSCPQISFEELCAASGDSFSDCTAQAEDPDETVQILYTTGTTGKSKGIEITHANNIALAENVSEGTQMKQGNVEFIPLPISHSHGLRCCYANFLKGGTVVLTDGMRGVKAIYDLIINYNVNAMDISPTAANVMLRLFKKVTGELNERLDYIQIGTAALPEHLKEALCAAFPDVRLYNFYGSTESGRSCVLNFNSSEDRKFCVGRPTKNARFIVTDDERVPFESSREKTGLLACAGAMNMKRYWKQPELTESIMKDGYIFTNDEAYIDENGYVYVLGRKDDVINYMGIKIAPEEIEEVAAAHPQVEDCCCVPKADKTAGQVPLLYVKVKNPEDFDKKELSDYLSGRIDSNKLPRQIELIDEIPRTANGKLQRKKLAVK